jgi:hypothetical protein
MCGDELGARGKVSSLARGGTGQEGGPVGTEGRQCPGGAVWTSRHRPIPDGQELGSLDGLLLARPLPDSWQIAEALGTRMTANVSAGMFAACLQGTCK